LLISPLLAGYLQILRFPLTCTDTGDWAAAVTCHLVCANMFHRYWRLCTDQSV